MAKIKSKRKERLFEIHQKVIDLAVRHSLACKGIIQALTFEMAQLDKPGKKSRVLKSYAREMIKCQADQDHEARHAQADKLLCELLTTLGFGDVVAEYEKIVRWCA